MVKTFYIDYKKGKDIKKLSNLTLKYQIKIICYKAPNKYMENN